MGNLRVFFQIFIVCSCLLILSMSTSLAAPASFDFEYTVDGQTIILHPSISASYDDYKWKIQGSNGIETTTSWISVDDIYDHRTTHMNATTYLIQLHVRCTTGQWLTAQYIRIGSNGTRALEIMEPTEEESVLLTNMPWLADIPVIVWVIISVFVISASIGFLLWDDRIRIYRKIRTK